MYKAATTTVAAIKEPNSVAMLPTITLISRLIIDFIITEDVF